MASVQLNPYFTWSKVIYESRVFRISFQLINRHLYLLCDSEFGMILCSIHKTNKMQPLTTIAHNLLGEMSKMHKYNERLIQGNIYSKAYLCAVSKHNSGLVMGELLELVTENLWRRLDLSGH